MRPWIIVGSFIFKQITHSLNILMEIYYFKNKWELLYKEKVKDILVDRELLKAPPSTKPPRQGGEHHKTMLGRWDDVQRDVWKESFWLMVKARKVLHDK